MRGHKLKLVRSPSGLPLLKCSVVVCLLLLTSACVTYEYHATKTVEPIRFEDNADISIPDEEVLDVGIVVFDPGLDLLDDDSAAYSNVRQSEAVWFASQLKSALEYSNVWGAVRAMPSANSIMDLQIDGKILESNGEILRLQIMVKDASGKHWYGKEYLQRASTYAYNPEVNSNNDPFQSLFSEISNDLYNYRAQLSSEKLLELRNIAKVRFAEQFLPQVYGDYLQSQEDIYSLQRIPASNDPMIMRIDSIRARNDLFLDVVQDYYRAFNGNMAQPYHEWRKTSYKEVQYERQLKAQSRNEKFAGFAAILVGVLAAGSSDGNARTAGHVGIFSGAELIFSGYRKQNEAEIHTATLRELGEGLEAELEPSVIDLEDRSITLSGTVEDQFQEWRRILTAMFGSELGAEAATLDAILEAESAALDDAEEQLSQASIESLPDTSQAIDNSNHAAEPE